MRKNGKLVWGLFFIFMAVFVLMAGMGLFGEVSVWTVGFAGLCIIWFVTGVFNLSYGNMLFPLACLAILFDKELGIEDITPWPVLIAALFGTIGLHMLFGDRKKKRNFVNRHSGVDGEFEKEAVFNDSGAFNDSKQNDESFQCSQNLGSTVKYVKCQNLKRADIKNSFGSCTVYFDGAKLNEYQATVNVSNNFGKIVLFVPSEWNVDIDATKICADITQSQRIGNVVGKERLVITGEVSFGSIHISYL